MTLNDIVDQCIKHQEYCITRPNYLARKTFIEVRDDKETLLQLRFDLDLPGTAFTPTLEDLLAVDWKWFIPEDHIAFEVPA